MVITDSANIDQTGCVRTVLLLVEQSSLTPPSMLLSHLSIPTPTHYLSVSRSPSLSISSSPPPPSLFISLLPLPGVIVKACLISTGSYEDQPGEGAVCLTCLLGNHKLRGRGFVDVEWNIANRGGGDVVIKHGYS